ncbi:hypothetical protein HBI56_186160 [Parastagonospora nodorum]|nr:hypothetical protein HBH53_113090 [Parastagonospora nodorum]KAH4044786.1 hypothetical protein HBH49_213170 [Parastagonospora nodorum]KAH4064401.1 hypothetical protein HBH50_178720 [Parastagonospora nodorum]KAH4084177.1 hypothetical protein HBH48_165770 [Parastagonospora nodorum]KAH4095463.1 hypothetical protein HBH46_168470 [Parastagonospora nodorum]
MAHCPSTTTRTVLIEDGNVYQPARIYDQSAAHTNHVPHNLNRMITMTYQRTPYCHSEGPFDSLDSLSTGHSAKNAISTIFNFGNRRRDQSIPMVSSNGDLGLCDRLKCAKYEDLKHVCQTERLHDDRLQETQTIALGFNTNSSKTSVTRWAPGSTLHYYIEHVGLSTTQMEIVEAGMRTAADHWQSTGLGITFEETGKWQEATFTIAYNPTLGLNHYALAFFPEWQRRVIDIGARLLGELQYVVEVLGHELGHPGQHKGIFIQDLVPRPAVEYLSLPPVQIVQSGGCAPAIRRQSIP